MKLSFGVQSLILLRYTRRYVQSKVEELKVKKVSWMSVHKKERKKYNTVQYSSVSQSVSQSLDIYVQSLKFIHPSIHSYIHSSIHSFSHLFISSFIHSLNHSYIHSSIHSFAPPSFLKPKMTLDDISTVWGSRKTLRMLSQTPRMLPSSTIRLIFSFFFFLSFL